MSKYVRSESKCKYDLEKTFEIPIILPEHIYTIADADRVTSIHLGQITPTEEDYRILDLNCDGKFTPFDAVMIRNIVNGSIIIPEDRIIGKIAIKNDGLLSGIVIENYLSDTITKFGLKYGQIVQSRTNKSIYFDESGITISDSENTTKINASGVTTTTNS